MAVVCATGMRTELGQIAQLLDQAGGEATPLQQRLEGLARVLGVGVGDTVRVLTQSGSLSPLGLLPRPRSFRVAGIFASMALGRARVDIRPRAAAPANRGLTPWTFYR